MMSQFDHIKGEQLRNKLDSLIAQFEQTSEAERLNLDPMATAILKGKLEILEQEIREVEAGLSGVVSTRPISELNYGSIERRLMEIKAELNEQAAQKEKGDVINITINGTSSGAVIAKVDNLTINQGKLS